MRKIRVYVDTSVFGGVRDEVTNGDDEGEENV